MSVGRSSVAHRFPVRVYYEDTDAAGIVYHANYLKFAERARTEWLRETGLDHPTLIERFGGQFAVRRCALDFKRPARLDDPLTVETSITSSGGASLALAQNVLRDGEMLVMVEIALVFINSALRASRLPPPLRQRLAES